MCWIVTIIALLALAPLAWLGWQFIKGAFGRMTGG